MKLSLKIFITILSIAILAGSARENRSSSSVKKEKKENARQIEKTRKDLSDNKERTARHLSTLNSLNGEIEQQATNIEALQAHIDTIDMGIAILSDSIKSIESNIQRLKKAVAADLRAQRTNRQKLNGLSFIFSAPSFTEAFHRLRYLNEMKNWYRAKTMKLKEAMRQLSIAQNDLLTLSKQQATALQQLTASQEVLKAKKNQQSAIVAELQREGNSLQAVLNDRQQHARELDRELDRIIADEKRRKDESRKKDDAATSSSKTKKDNASPKPATTGEAEKERALSGSFQSNKGRLLFPVAGRYTIVGNFGRTTPAGLSKVSLENHGIDIQVSPGTMARAVFDGEVSSIFTMPDNPNNNVVFLRHGSYITVYSGIDNLSVRKGDKVKSGQNIGRIMTNPFDSNHAILHFEVRKEREKLNPLQWIK